MVCKICGSESSPIFTKKVLHKYDVSYNQCKKCLFIQTEEPYWLNEAYSSAINSSDIGLISRNVIFTEMVTALFGICKFSHSSRYLDYGGGYGMFVRMMRDNGYNFYWSDEYCENIYATKFKANELPQNDQRYEALTAFEVFEHLVNPMADIEKMLQVTDSVLFSNELQPNDLNKVRDWWYIAPQHGQHVSFYNLKTLEFICEKFGLNLYSHKNMHLLTKKKLSKTTYNFAVKLKFARIYNTIFTPESLMGADYDMYLKEQ